MYSDNSQTSFQPFSFRNTSNSLSTIGPRKYSGTIYIYLYLFLARSHSEQPPYRLASGRRRIQFYGSWNFSFASFCTHYILRSVLHGTFVSLNLCYFLVEGKLCYQSWPFCLMSNFFINRFILAQSCLILETVLQYIIIIQSKLSFTMCKQLYLLSTLSAYQILFLDLINGLHVLRYQYIISVYRISYLFIYLMALNLDKLVSSESNYEMLIKQSLDIIKRDKDIESTLKKIILFCKYAFSVNFAQRKKYLCLCLIRDISDKIKSNYFQKILDENIPIKLLKTISNQQTNKLKQSRHQDDQTDYTDKLLRFAIETINFWTKKLSILLSKSQFSIAYQELKKNNRIQFLKNYQFYKVQKLTTGLWGQKAQNQQQLFKNSQINPLITQLFDKFNECKVLIQEKINQAVQNEEQLYLKPLIQKLRDFLFVFFSKYKNLQIEGSLDRDQLVVYFHIINSLFKRICNKFYISVQEMISTTKEVFQANHNADFSSIDRMDIINLAGIHKYNAINIFQRIKQKIETQEAKLGPCQLTFEQKDILVYANQKNNGNNSVGKGGKQMQDRRSPKFKR